MNIWESYQALSPLPRIEVTFGITLLVVCLIFWWGNRIKKQAEINQAQAGSEQANSSLIEQKDDGIFYIYIAWSRYLGLIAGFALMLYVLSSECISLYKDLPKDFLHHWNKDVTLVLIGAIGVIMVAAYIISLLREAYKPVQMEIGKDYVRFRIRAVRSGILLSDKYVTLNYSEIEEINFSQAPIGGYVLSLKTAIKTYNINLLLSPAEKIASYRILDKATSNWQQQKTRNSRG